VVGIQRRNGNLGHGVAMDELRKFDVDLSKISIKEYRLLFDTAHPAEQDDALYARCLGLTIDEFQALPYPDYRRAIKAFFDKAKEPLADPNSASVSISG
jgi:hypothetical protein